MDWLAKAWDSEVVAELESDIYLDMTIRRPDIDFGPDRTKLTWPDTKIYLAHAPNSKQDLLLLGGFEPHFSWKQYCEQIANYADALGVKTLVCIRSFPSDVPHTRPAPMLLRSSDIELELQFGVQAQGSRYQGPTDISESSAPTCKTTCAGRPWTSPCCSRSTSPACPTPKRR